MRMTDGPPGRYEPGGPSMLRDILAARLACRLGRMFLATEPA
jgi:hypothetical protein